MESILNVYQKIKNRVSPFIPLLTSLLSIVSLVLLLSDYFSFHSDAQGLAFGYADKYTEAQPFQKSELDQLGKCAIKEGCVEWNCPCMREEGNCAYDRRNADGNAAPYNKATGERSGCVLFYSNCPKNYCTQCKTFREYAARVSLQVTIYMMFKFFLYLALAAYAFSLFYMWKVYKINHHLPVIGGIRRSIHFFKKIFHPDHDTDFDKEMQTYDVLVCMWESTTLDLPNVVIKLYIYGISQGLPTAFDPTTCTQVPDWRFLTFLISIYGVLNTIYSFIVARFFQKASDEIEMSIISSEARKSDPKIKYFVNFTVLVFVLATVISFGLFGYHYPNAKEYELKECEKMNQVDAYACQSLGEKSF
jgi:hypothetical protein